MAITGIPLDKYSTSAYSIPESYKTEKVDLYHYTSLDAFIKMLSAYEDHKFIEFWPSHLLYSNDSEEYNDGLSLIKTTLENSWEGFPSQVKKKFFTLLELETAVEKEVYILCLSSDGDSLTQWKYYGDESGIAVQFNLNHNEVGFSGLAINDNLDLKRPAHYPVGPYEVKYTIREKRGLINKIIQNVWDSNKDNQDHIEKERNLYMDLKQLIGLCPLLKNKYFKDEKEFRMIFRPCYEINEEEEIPKLIHYRYKNGRNVPHMKIHLHLQNTHNNETLINSIIVGPGYNQKIVLNALKHMAARRPNLISIENINPSDIPFRD